MAGLRGNVGKLAMVCALAGAAWLLAMIVIGGATYPGYDHMAQYISELGANGAPHGFAVSWLGFLPVGVLVITFAVLAWLAAPRSVLSTLGFVGVVLFAVGYVGAAFFRCDFGCRPETPSFSQQMHVLFGLAGYLLAPLTLLLLALAARRWPHSGALPLLGYAAAIGALAGLLTLDPASLYVGLSQRVLEASVIGWVAVCGLYLGGRPQKATG
jgi:hypothetical membrane protein